MGHQYTLDLEWSDHVTGGLDDVIGSAKKPEVTVGVAANEVARQVPAFSEALPVAFLIVKVAAKHRWPAGLKRKLTFSAGLVRETSIRSPRRDARLPRSPR